MKTFGLSIFLLSFILVLSSAQSQSALGYDQNNNPLFEDQLSNSTKTTTVNDYPIILDQTAPKLTYDIGETIPINTTLINLGNKTMRISYLEPEFFLEIKNQAGKVIWPSHTIIGWVPEFSGEKTLKPGERFNAQPWGVTMNPGISPPTAMLLIPGNYTAISVGLFAFNVTNGTIQSHLEPVWSKPLHLTVLPEKYFGNETNLSAVTTPEFPFAIPMLIISITSLIIFYRIRIRK